MPTGGTCRSTNWIGWGASGTRRAASVSIQQMVAYVPGEDARAHVTELSARRFGMMGGGLVLGNGAELVDHFAGLVDQGVERFYVWFTDFATPDTLAGFGADVIATLAHR